MFAFKYVIEIGIQGYEIIDKVVWTKKILHVFCDLCIKAIDIEMRPNAHFNKVGWKFLLTSFKEQTSCAFKKA